MLRTSDNVPREIFVGGRTKGLTILKYLLALRANIVHCFILKEDVHEIEVVSPDIMNLCNNDQIPYTVCSSLKNHGELIRTLRPDLIVVAGWRTIIPQTILNIPARGSIAFHESLLPRYRGFAPVNWAVINGEEKTGVTLFYLDNGIDTGYSIGQETIRIGRDMTAWELYQETIRASVRLLETFHGQIMNGTAPKRTQREHEATYTCARVPEDGHINWNSSTKTIHNLIRGLSYPYPGAYSYVKEQKIIIQKAHIPPQRKYAGRVPGRVVAMKDTGVEILTGDGSLVVENVQLPGGDIQPAKNVITSIRTTLT